MNKVTPFLMFNDQLEAAIEFYTELKTVYADYTGTKRTTNIY